MEWPSVMPSLFIYINELTSALHIYIFFKCRPLNSCDAMHSTPRVQLRIERESAMDSKRNRKSSDQIIGRVTPPAKWHCDSRPSRGRWLVFRFNGLFGLHFLSDRSREPIFDH